MKSIGGIGTKLGGSWGILILLLAATQLAGCGWYLRPSCPPCGVPYYGEGGLGGNGYAKGGREGAGAPGEDMWNAGGKNRFDGQPKYMLDTVYFDFDSSEIRSDQLNALERNLAWMKQNPGAPLRIEGHCDERGTEEYNLALGDHRADSVREWLVRHGVDSSRLQSVSKGELDPADPGHGEAAWSKNRRAEFLVLE